jgi:hypothetical protein
MPRTFGALWTAVRIQVTPHTLLQEVSNEQI